MKLYSVNAQRVIAYRLRFKLHNTTVIAGNMVIPRTNDFGYITEDSYQVGLLRNSVDYKAYRYQYEISVTELHH